MEQEKFHSPGGLECGMAWPVLFPPEVVLAIRLARVLQSSTPSIAAAPQARAVSSLDTHLAELSPEAAAHYAGLAVVAHAVWQRASERATMQDPLNAQLTVADLLRALLQVRINGLAITPSAYDGKDAAIALGMFPVASLMSHSCDANTSLRFRGKTLIARAFRPLPRSTPVLHCYGPQVGEMTTEQRRAMLKEQYCFDCKCAACTAPPASEKAMVGLRCTTASCSGALSVPCAAPAGLASKFDLEGTPDVGCEECRALLTEAAWNKEVKPQLELALREFDAAKKSMSTAMGETSTVSEGKGPREVAVANSVKKLQESLRLREKLLHPHNQVLGATHDALGWACHEAQGRFAYAMVPHVQASMEIAEALFPPDSTNIAFQKMQLAGLPVKNSYELRAQATATLMLHYGPGFQEEFEVIDM